MHSRATPPRSPLRFIFIFGKFCVVSRGELGERHAALGLSCIHEVVPFVLCRFGTIAWLCAGHRGPHVGVSERGVKLRCGEVRRKQPGASELLLVWNGLNSAR